MEHKDIKVIRERLNDYKSPINTDAAWATYQKNNKTSKVKLYILRSLLGIGTVGLLFGLGFWYNSSKADNLFSATTESSSTNEITTNNTAQYEEETVTEDNNQKQSTEVPSNTNGSNGLAINNSFAKNRTSNNTDEKYTSTTPKVNWNTAEKPGIKTTPNSTPAQQAVTPTAKATKALNDPEKSQTEQVTNASNTLVDKEDSQKDGSNKPINSNVANANNSTSASQQTEVNDEVTESNNISSTDIELGSKVTKTPDDTIPTYEIPLPLALERRKHFVSFAYNYGIRDKGLNSSHKNANSRGVYVPHGHQSLVLSYKYQPITRIAVQGGISGGIGYLNGNSPNGYDYVVKQSEWGAEGIFLFTPFNHGRFSADIGIGAFYRNFEINYQSGSDPNIELDGPAGLIGPSSEASFADAT